MARSRHSTGDRYDVSGLPEAQWQPGSRGRVLRNLPGIIGKREMDHLEAEAQAAALRKAFTGYGANHRFTVGDLQHLHFSWLGEIYPWAGTWRQVNLSKENMPFAAAAHIPSLMEEFQAGPLSLHTPCHPASSEAVALSLATVHTELMLIHPFRDGNGRLGRILATLMGLQAGLPLLDFSLIRGEKRDAYFSAVRAGLDRDYRPMQGIFEQVIARTMRIYGKRTSSGASGVKA